MATQVDRHDRLPPNQHRCSFVGNCTKNKTEPNPMATTQTNNTDLARAEILWKAADTLRGQVDAAEYKHVVLGLLFLKY